MTSETYTNPVGDGLLMGDPFVLKHGGRHYLFGTTDPDVGFRCYTSANLVDWQEEGFAYRRVESSWGRPPFWAPEVVLYRGWFYMTYSALDRKRGRLLMQAEQDWARINFAENRANEGPFVLKHGQRYFMTYSANPE